ncbi:hypothetical protein [Ruegeria hyattellae]|uniref:hypothetical protein n=1 Tax=Ruegeria hyattellae TaxID=3233337 RepID=UPI00355B4675
MQFLPERQALLARTDPVLLAALGSSVRNLAAIHADPKKDRFGKSRCQFRVEVLSVFATSGQRLKLVFV